MKALKIMILFIVVLSGCSKKYLASTEEELIDHRVFSSWKELDGKVVGLSDKGFSLGLQVKDFAIIRDHLKLKEVYVRSSGEGGSFMAQLGAVVGFVGCIWGYNYAKSANCWYGEDDKVMEGCMVSCASFFTFFGFMKRGASRDFESVKIIPDYIKIDTICVDSVSLSEEEVKIMVKNTNFEKLYYTSKEGNIDLIFDEIIPEPTEADSILNLIIRYYELVDTVDVNIR